ncbi:MAG: serine/threonine-protein kinase HipA [Motiliproteus sp.]
MSFTPIKRLDVWRRYSQGQRARVGTLAQSPQGVFFQYDEDYLRQHSNISPFQLAFTNALQAAPNSPHHGLHGVFGDSIPDGWGLLLMDRMFRQAGILPSQITAMDRLAFVGNSGMGALSYSPVSDFAATQSGSFMSVGDLGLQAQALFDGQTQDVLAALVAAGSSGGARPKAQLYFCPDNPQLCSTQPQEGLRAWLVKFTSQQLALGHEEGLCEAVYLTLARQAAIEVPGWQLVDAPEQSGAKKWLALERFDTFEYPDKQRPGRLHLHSACGLLDADFRLPSLDYEDLIKASSLLCQSPAAGQQQFRRAMFNLFGMNQDDHSKNWAFLQSDEGRWSPAPFYDVTFSPSPFGEHSTAFAGFGKKPPLKAIQRLASQANYKNWAQARRVIEEVVTAIGQFATVARQLGVSAESIDLIERQLNQVYQENKALLT